MDQVSFRAITPENWKGLSLGDLREDGSGRLALKEGRREGSYTFALLDSGQVDCIWHRIVIEAHIPENSSISLSFRGSNSGNEFDSQGVAAFNDGDRDALIMDRDRGEIRGRYIEITVHLQREGIETPRLSMIQVYYPRISYLRYLPAVYQEDEASRRFLERFLSIFESDLQESEDLISNIPALIDPHSAPSRFLPGLAQWLALDLYELMGERNRDYLANAVELYKWKGTARGLRLLAETLTGRRCCIREFSKSIFRTYGMESMEEEMLGAATSAGECGSNIRMVSSTVDTRNLDVSKMGTSQDQMHYITDSSPDGLYSSKTVGIYILLVGNEGLPVDRDDLQRIIDSFLPVYVKARIIIENVEPVRRSHATDLIDEKVWVCITKYSRERPKGSFSVFYEDSASFSFIKSYPNGAAGVTNRADRRTYHRHIAGMPLPD